MNLVLLEEQPKGYCEVWQGHFSSDREVDIIGEGLCSEIPGLHFCVSYTEQRNVVLGLFYVPHGYSLADRVNLVTTE